MVKVNTVGKQITRSRRKTHYTFDQFTEEGTIIRGCVYVADFVPSKNYHEKLTTMDLMTRKILINKLIDLQQELIDQFGIPQELLIVDEEQLRLLTAYWVAEKLSEECEGWEEVKFAVVEQYPSPDQTLLDVQFLPYYEVEE